MTCPTPEAGGAFLSGMLGYIDCQALALGEGGYQALASAGSSASIALGIALTLFVALLGYRLVLGETPGIRDGVVAAAKVGIVLALATSWPAFRTLAYDVAFDSPAQLAAELGQRSELPGAGGGLVARLQAVDDGLARLVILGAGRPPEVEMAAAPTQPNAGDAATAPADAGSQPQTQSGDPQRDASLLGHARTLYLTGTIAAFGSVRAIAGLLLALGPLFALFLLFDATRGLFEGWVRGLAGAALGALGTAIVLGVQLAIMEPWLGAVLAARAADVPTPSVPIELLVMTLGFGLVLLAVLIATARLAAGFRLPVGQKAIAPPPVPNVLPAPANDRLGQSVDARPADRSRAVAIAEAVAATQRREATVPRAPAFAPALASGSRAPASRLATAAAAPGAEPLGRSFQRRARGRRVSAGAARRDRATG